jgi:zinc D-Ala-D-Ala carboxypeptidase
VFAIQYLLRAWGYSLSADGKFGPQTLSAVKGFQGAKGLATDGIVGPNTWTALIQGHTVKMGSSGDDVRAVQHLLRNAHGYDIAVDGIFGSKTQAAVTGFQKSRGLAVDGIVGPQTWKALVAGL